MSAALRAVIGPTEPPSPEAMAEIRRQLKEFTYDSIAEMPPPSDQ
jgi:hypothetical protein